VRLASHEAYFEYCAPSVRPLLLAIQNKVEAVLPDAVRCIRYQMPAYQAPRVFFYFAAFKKHIGVYPPVHTAPELIAKLAPYRGVKGNLSFPLNQPLPIALIGQVALALHRQYQV
jgi:uncharacterized protein YdhG (YjbR/CyaY superfamily)